MKSITIKSIKNKEDFNTAVKIFSDAFSEDTLFRFAFPDKNQRLRLTKIIYEFVVKKLVPIMKLKLKGLYVNGKLVSVCTYSTPESKKGWTDELSVAVDKMQKKANDKFIGLIGEYSVKSRQFKIKEPHFYFNELAVTPGEQGKGCGKIIFEYVESQCRKHPAAKSVWLDTPNPVNIKIYKHLGYKIMHRFKFYDLTGCLMCKITK